ncbi:MAG TPA: alanine--tRNA ligase [Planctomycetota bacterium]|nr:alanine--tRNA ligase [Planctomycetota bacterium]
MTSQRPATSAREVRQQFLDFFRERGHTVVPSASVAPGDDPTLLFTNAGLNQFKDVFLGTGSRPYTRAVDTQKCIRVSGKHNDLEEVGLDTYHHTFFEMLGNWSFGDYFKREAIRWSWELLTEVWKLPKERLWATVFGGDAAQGLPADEEAERIWREETDIDPAHVLRFGRKDNFWEMGETGPCGPCTEIHIDRGAEGSDPREGADPRLGVNAGNERFIELWNNVFMQFNRRDDGTLSPLPACHVDTGMGFERILSVLQGKRSNYDTDLFGPLFDALGDIAGRPYGASASRADVAFRVCADHMRAVTAAISDGALPSNTGRGYVLRRLIRRAARFGRQELGLEQPFLHELVPAVAEVLGPAFPEMAARVEHVARLVLEEEKAFGRTLGRGLVLFDELAAQVAAAGGKRLDGERAFDLYATYGFPQDLVELMLRERDWELDRAGWDAAEERHRAASRGDGETFKQLLSAEQLEGLAATPTTYYEEGEAAWRAEAKVAFFVASPDGSRGKLVLERTPFYPESGGQVGDTGTIEASDGSWRLAVEDTQKLGGVVVHLGALEGREPAAGDAAVACADIARREHIKRNHSATHLLHWALRDLLGEHVTQQGSYVGPERLRFDFSHPEGLSAQQIEELERRINAEVLGNREVATTVEDLEQAKQRGVTALFGEKYEDRVRVVAIGSTALELCGGTHVRAGGDIGPFVVLSERAIQAGVRRLEALTGAEALAWIQSQRRTLQQAARALKSSPEDLPGRIEALQEQLKEARKKSAQGAKADAGAALERLRAALETHSGVACAVLDVPELDQAGVRDLGDRARGALRDFAVVLVGRQGDKLPFLALCEGAALERGLKAGELAGLLKAHLGGGGGGKPDVAQGAGNDASALEAALAAVRERFAALDG